MAKKKRTSIVPLAIVLIVAALVTGTWGYQTALRRGWINVSPAPSSTSLPPAQTPPTGPNTPPPPLRIATWNIRQFGGRPSTDLLRVAEVISQNYFDVVAIQEIYRDGRAVDALLNQLGPPWRGTRLGPESRSGERLSFIYRGDRVVELKQTANLAGASSKVFDRIPYTATFKCGQFDFELVTVHLSWSDASQRQEEMLSLAALVSQLSAAQSEKDIIVLGDFNEQRSRPNLHYLQQVGWQSVVTQTTNLSSREIYDHIVFNPAFTREYASNVGVIRFDETLFGNDDKVAASALSDHRPVYADFQITGPDDD